MTTPGLAKEKYWYKRVCILLWVFQYSISSMINAPKKKNIIKKYENGD
jgi:hypothetical protein